MNTVSAHGHTFDESAWPFADPVNALAIATKRVFYERFPILLVSHDSDGDWQVLCGTSTDGEQAMVVCLGCAYERDNTIGQLADMPRGWRAWRADVNSPWEREPKDSENADA